MNKKTRALTEEQYRKIITTINEGFVTAAGERVKPNSRIATALTLEANLGLRISDILHLTINQIVKDGDRYRLDLVEQKTGKKREFTVPTEIYIYIQNYALENNINPRARLFQITERTVQRHLKMVCDYLEYEYISTHSFRKFFASSIYKDNGCDINLVRVLLQHSSVVTTQRYIGVQPQEIENALQKETAFMRIMSDKYTDELSKINVPIDLSQYKGRYTLETAKKEIPEIEEDLILLYEQEIEKKLNIS